MKTIPPICPEPEVGPKYWRSLDQLAETPEFNQWVEREFPAGASEFNDPVSRRHFVKIMSASFLLGGLGLTGCRKPEEHILPFSKMPEGYIHGVAQYYATARPTRGSAVPLLVKSSDGRPTKIEGNPQHPDSIGGTDTFTQASILDLYDPDRAMRFTRSGNEVSKEVAFDFLAELSKKFQGNNGAGLCFLMERSSSPSRERLQKVISQKFPKARWFVHEAIDLDLDQQAASIAFGQPVRPQYRLEKAKRILSLDCDFIGAERDAYRTMRGFVHGRKLDGPNGEMNRLYAIEALFTLTGANADHRLRIPASQVLAAAARIAVEISGNVPGEVSALAKSFTGDEKWIQECAKDLRAHGKSSLVLAGHRQPLAVHLIANAINSALGSIGETVVFVAAPENNEGSISELVSALNSGGVDTLVVLGNNPAYTAPVDVDWSKAQAKAKTVLRLGYYEDESFAGSTWHFPQAHYLESWGDARTSDGTIVSVQPLIRPLFDGVTEIEILARLAGERMISPYEIVRETFAQFSKGGDEAWKKFLHDGFLANTAAKPVQVRLGSISNGLRNVSVAPAPSAQSLEVVFHRDYKVDDGRYNNNGWLQELPDPVTKMTWENVILLSEKTAKDLGLVIINHEDNRLKVPWVKIQLNGREVEGPAWIQPGQADNTIGLALGYGREKTGRIGRGSGYNAYKVRTASALYFATGAKLTDTGKIHPLSTTQDHGAMEGRPIIREANLEQFKEHPEFAKAMDYEKPPSTLPLYPNPLDKRMPSAVHQWGMSIDLNSCTGCAACMVACQSENNVPIVGKEQVSNNREMHWLRIDRYYAGSVSDPQMAMQPMLCQHCEAAPCENVCPVNATSHNDEGLNVMTYNRCVGTRYCSNNCPYKVRRFNFFDYNKRPLNGLYKGPLAKRPQDELDLIKLVKNPQVTVRMRGVMEKCSFCLQRIEGAKIAQKVKAGASGDITVPEGTFTTACAQACPTEAIVFGNLKDENSRVSQLKKQERDYAVLEFLATKPRLTYLAKVRNPNPALHDAYSESPGTTQEYAKKAGKGENPFEESGIELHGKNPVGEGEPTRKGVH